MTRKNENEKRPFPTLINGSKSKKRATAMNVHLIQPKVTGFK